MTTSHEYLEIEPTVAPLDDSEIRALNAKTKELYLRLPPLLPARELWEIGAKPPCTNSASYEYAGLEFEIPPGVLRPGGTSEKVFEYLLSTGASLGDKSVAFMGVGGGVEIVLATKAGANPVYGFDIDPTSVRAAKANCATHGVDSSNLFVSDLFSSFDAAIKFDVVFFNPPSMAVKVEDPVTTRNKCVGSDIVCRFLAEIAQRHLLKPRGSAVVIISNCTHLDSIVAQAVRNKFTPRILAKYYWPAPYERIETFLFGFEL